MNIQNINIGQYPNDGTGDDLRTAFEKIVANFSEIDLNVVLSAENVGQGTPIVIENASNNALKFRTIKSSNNKLSINYDSFNVVLTVSDVVLDDLINVNATNPSLNQVLSWNGVEWSATNINFNFLSDLSSVTPLEKQLLSWNGSAWQPQSINFSYLSDFSQATPSINQVITWNGSAWQPTSLSINALSDVAIINPEIGDSLIWNGSRWISQPVSSDFGVTKIIAGNNITINPTTGVGEVTINSTATGSGITDGFDFGNILYPNNMLELLIQFTAVDFGTILSPSSVNLDLNFGTTTEPSYQFFSSVSTVAEGSSVVITLVTANVSNGTLIPYVITGVTSDDINNSSLTGNFLITNNVASLTIPISIDLISEQESLTITLTNITPAVSLTINISDFTQSQNIDGGDPGTIVFLTETSGGLPETTTFESVIDGGLELYVLDGGSPSITADIIYDGGIPTSTITSILDGYVSF